ncbi:DUF732 domain-containing protein [Streptomyces longwoodensis]|uniref:DUF732 domain-containing protein n=1 Tax=Streptomyces longwoodensis TaxID=68231 RepID=UPI0036EE014F
MNARTAIAALLTAATLALTACSSTTDDASSDTKPKATASASPKASPSKAKYSTNETAFLLTTRTKIPALKKVPDDQLLDLGHSACTAIDAGNSPTAVALQTEKGLQIGVDKSAYIVGAAVSQFCPQHKDQL